MGGDETEGAELIERILAAWNAGDPEDFAALTAPDVELRPMRAQLEGKAYRGRQGVHEMFAEVTEDWEELRVTVEEIRRVGDLYVARLRLTGTGKTSGVEIDVMTGWIFEVRDGLMAYTRAYSDPEDAFAAAREADR